MKFSGKSHENMSLEVIPIPDPAMDTDPEKGSGSTTLSSTKVQVRTFDSMDADSIPEPTERKKNARTAVFAYLAK